VHSVLPILERCPRYDLKHLYTILKTDKSLQRALSDVLGWFFFLDSYWSEILLRSVELYRQHRILSQNRGAKRVLLSALTCRSFIHVYSRRVTGLHRRAKGFELNFVIGKISPLDGQTRWAKSSAQLVNLSSVPPLLKTHLTWLILFLAKTS